MNHGKEISQKIRSAIKAKLIELNAYVDDELPDYIMVMVANKKSKEQMNDDLGLFLSHNTEKFTEWLHGLLEKLQSLGSDQQKSKEIELSNAKETDLSASSKEKTVNKAATSEKSKSVKEKPAAKVKNDSKSASSKSKSSSKSKNEVEEKSIVKDKTAKVSSKSTVVERKGAKKVVKATKRPAVVVQDEDVLTDLLGNRGETDEFSAEFKEEPEVKKVKKTVVAAERAIVSDKISPKSTVDNPRIGSVHSRLGTPRSLSSDDRSRNRRNLPRAVTSPIRRASSPSRRNAQRIEHQPSRQVFPVRKKQPMSYVGKVRARDFEEEDEEEDAAPSGGMSSVVSITARRSSVPLSQQANKSLILRATKEAEQSVNSKLSTVLNEERMYSEKEKALVRPIQRRAEKNVTVTLHGKTRVQEGLLSKSKRESLGILGPEDRRVDLDSKNRRQQVIRGMTYTIQNRLSQKPKPLQQSRSTGQEVARVRPVIDNRYVLRVKPEEEEGSTESSVVEDEDVDTLFEEDQAQTSPADSHELDLQTPSSDELDPEVQRILQEEDEAIQDLETADSPQEEDNTEDVLSVEEEIPKEDEVNDDDDEEEQRRKLLRQQKLMRQNARAIKRRAQLEIKRNPKKQKSAMQPVDTRFIVTLDGIDPDNYDDRNTPDPSKLEEECSVTPDTEVLIEDNNEDATNSVVLNMMPPEIKPISISLKDTDDEDEESEALPSTLAKSTERCRFWPACVNGNACPYVHPTLPCKLFPNCKFAEKCLYIHPNCKFDSKCTRKDCPFTHASKRNNFTTVIKQVLPVPIQGPALGRGGGYQQNKTAPICRFFPNCTNMNCTFIHPQPCRFGVSCMNKNACKFYHPPIPTKDKLTWTSSGKQEAAKTHKSERLFDAGPAQKMPTQI